MTESPLARPLTGRIAVVTGAARGIGRAAAVALARTGADEAGIDIAARVSPILDFEPASVEDLTHTGELVTAAGGRWVQHIADQRNIDAVRAAADAVAQQWGGIDTAFANAGIQALKPLLDVSDADWHDQIDVNLSGTANILRVRSIVGESRRWPDHRHVVNAGPAQSEVRLGVLGVEVGNHRPPYQRWAQGPSSKRASFCMRTLGTASRRRSRVC